MADDPWAEFTKPPQVAPGSQPSVDPWQEFTTPPKQSPSSPMSWSDVPSEAASNIVPSAVQLAKDVATPFLQPVETAKAIGNLGLGAVEKLIPGGEYPHEKYANAVGEHFAERYGGMENLKKTMATDPMGFLTDVATVLTGGGALAARAPGIAGTVARTAKTVGSAVDPLMMPLNAIKPVSHVASEIVANLGTHTGGESLRGAFRSGLEGGDAGKAFRENMRGNVPLDNVVADARGAISQMRAERNAEYRAGMTNVGKDLSVLHFNDIDKALADANKIKKFKGVELSPETAGVRKQITDAVDHWKSLDPVEYHTPVGMDALKQRIGSIKDSLPYNTPERLVAEKAYNSIRETITKQAPAYDKIMKGYEMASNQIDEIAKTLSLGQKSGIDTALRKLQSVIRNNVNTNFGKRTELAKTLTEHGAPNLMSKLSGQALNSWTPRGLGTVTGSGAGLGALYTMNPYLAATVPLHSPRLVGEATHLAGRSLGLIPKAVRENIEPALLSSRLAGEIPAPNRKGGKVSKRPNSVYSSQERFERAARMSRH